MEIQYFEGLLPEDKQACKTVLERVYELPMGKLMKGAHNDMRVAIEPGCDCEVGYACAWNKPSMIGETVRVMATDGLFCVVAARAPLNAPNNIYRCEDLLTYYSPAKL